MRWRALLWGAMLMATVVAARAAGGSPAPGDAETLIKSTAQDVLSTVNRSKTVYQKSPQELYGLVDKRILPLVDASYMTRLALGRFWRQASESQQQQITAAFTKLLVRTYADTLLQYSSDQIQWLPLRADPGARYVTVRASVQTKSGPPVAMNYRMRFNDGKWEVYDVTVGGISLVTTYRSSFEDLIQREGIGGLIKTLRKKVGGAPAEGS